MHKHPSTHPSATTTVSSAFAEYCTAIKAAEDQYASVNDAALSVYHAAIDEATARYEQHLAHLAGRDAWRDRLVTEATTVR